MTYKINATSRNVGAEVRASAACEKASRDLDAYLVSDVMPVSSHYHFTPPNIA
jgi:hypothetical protein